MTPEKFYDYLEGTLPETEREELERALIHDPELQRQFVAARQIHRTLGRPPDEPGPTNVDAGRRGRQLAAAFAVLVLMNVALGLIYIFRANQPPAELQKARIEALRQQLQGSLEKSAAAAFSPPTIGMERIFLKIPRAQQEAAAKSIIDAAASAGGSATKGLPNDTGFNVLVLIPGSGEAAFREVLAHLGATTPSASPERTASPNEMVHLEIVLSDSP
jgi:hypothetical protein